MPEVGTRSSADKVLETAAPETVPPRFAQGDAVSVPRYGLGVVDAIDSVGITVLFAGDRRRVFLAAFVRPATGMAGRRSRPQPSSSSARS
jgi:hypothetical protein